VLGGDAGVAKPLRDVPRVLDVDGERNGLPVAAVAHPVVDDVADEPRLVYGSRERALVVVAALDLDLRQVRQVGRGNREHPRLDEEPIVDEATR